jgi:hypothetical protein
MNPTTSIFMIADPMRLLILLLDTQIPERIWIFSKRIVFPTSPKLGNLLLVPADQVTAENGLVWRKM